MQSMHMDNLFKLEELRVGRVMAFISRTSPEPRWFRITAVLQNYRWERGEGEGCGDCVELTSLHAPWETITRVPEYLTMAATWHLLEKQEH